MPDEFGANEVTHSFLASVDLASVRIEAKQFLPVTSFYCFVIPSRQIISSPNESPRLASSETREEKGRDDLKMG